MSVGKLVGPVGAGLDAVQEVFSKPGREGHKSRCRSHLAVGRFVQVAKNNPAFLIRFGKAAFDDPSDPAGFGLPNDMRLCDIRVRRLEMANKHRERVILQFEAIPSKNRMISQIRRQTRQFEVRSGLGRVASRVDWTPPRHRCDIETAPIVSVKAVAMGIGS